MGVAWVWHGCECGISVAWVWVWQPPEALQQVAVVLPDVLHKQLLQQCGGALCLLCSFRPAGHDTVSPRKLMHATHDGVRVMRA